MKQALREALGKAAYEGNRQWAKQHNVERDDFMPEWEDLEERQKELERYRGEAAVSRFMDLMVANITPIVYSREDQEFQDAAKFLEGQDKP